LNGTSLQMAFLIESQIPTDKWPSLLGSNSLGSAMVNGKGGSADGISDRIADSDRQVALASWQWRLAQCCVSLYPHLSSTVSTYIYTHTSSQNNSTSTSVDTHLPTPPPRHIYRKASAIPPDRHSQTLLSLFPPDRPQDSSSS